MLSVFLFPLIFLADHYHFEISIALQAIIILVVSIICQLLRREPLNELIGRVSGKWFKELFIGLIVGSALMMLPAFLLTAFGFIHWQKNVFALSTLASGVSVMLVVAIAEELLFRGFIFQRFIGAFGNWPAQLIIAGLFLLTHLNNPGMTGVTKTLASVNIFITSILFGIAFIKTKKLAMPLGLHFAANVMQGTVLGFGVSGEKEVSLFEPRLDSAPEWLTGGAFGLEASIVGLFSLIMITILIYFWKYPKN